MELKIEQEKLDKILEMLMLDNVFPYCPIRVTLDKDKNPYLVSYQETETKFIFRYAKFFKDHFKYIKPEEETIHINAKKLHKVISREDPKTVLHIFTEDGKLKIQTEKTKAELHLIEESTGTCAQLPFTLDKEGTVVFTKAGPLENRLKIGIQDFKTIIEYAKVLDTDIYQFVLDEKKRLTVRVGDLESHAEKVVYEPFATVEKFESPVKTTVSLVMKELANTLSSDVTVQLKTNYPMFFSEQSHTHRYGVLVAPHKEQKE